MAVYTRITKEELEDFLQKFELGKLIYFNEISEGVENSNFKITTNLNSYILTIFEKRVSLNDLPFFINLMNHLYLNNFKCPKPIQNIKGEYIHELKDKPCSIVSFIEGNWVKKIENIQDLESIINNAIFSEDYDEMVTIRIHN